MTEHIMIGAGAFALGFAGDLFARTAALRTAIITRAPQKKPPGERGTQSVVRDNRLNQDGSYDVNYDGNAHSVNNITLFTCEYDNPSHEVSELFTYPELKLITVAVPEAALKNAATLLRNGLTARHAHDAGAKLPLILALVNAPSNAKKLLDFTTDHCSASLLTYIQGQRVAFSDCVVDRICSAPQIVSGRVALNVERHASLTICKSQYSDFLADYEKPWMEEYGMQVLRFVDSIEPWELLKYWGLNGLHILLASVSRTPIYATQDNTVSASTIGDIISNPIVASLAEGYLAEVSVAIRTRLPGQISREDILSFFSGIQDRLKTSTDTNTRLLKDLRLNDPQYATSLLKAFLTKYDIENEEAAEDVMDDIIAHAIGDFIKKVDSRMLGPTFHLSGTERLFPLNLAIGTSCALHAMANQLRT